jgi:uncharacterized repeat protein (TIGR03803 family)
MKSLRVVCVLGGFLFLVLSMPAQTFTTLYSFCSQSGCADGDLPSAGLVQGFTANFYGTTNYGGMTSDGTVFEITPSGALTTLHSFDFTDGYLPEAPLVQAINGDLYGTTSSGGADGIGTVFEITARGKLTTLDSYCSQSSCPNGYVSFGGAGPGYQWDLLRGNGLWRYQQFWCGFQNHSRWQVDHAIQLLLSKRLHGRRVSL